MSKKKKKNITSTSTKTLENIFNEWWLRLTTRDQRKTYQQNMQNSASRRSHGWHEWWEWDKIGSYLFFPSLLIQLSIFFFPKRKNNNNNIVVHWFYFWGIGGEGRLDGHITTTFYSQRGEFSLFGQPKKVILVKSRNRMKKPLDHPPK